MSQPRTVHVVGAGLAGLAAALTVAEAGIGVQVHEQAPRGGGRCRSFWDEKLSLKIDNGNHFIMSGNDAAMGLLRRNGAGEAAVIGPAEAIYPFYDHERSIRYEVRPGLARTPLWALTPGRSVPGAGFLDYAEGGALLTAPPEATLEQVIRRRGELWRGFWEPLAIAALNAAPEQCQARLLAPVLTKTFLRGGAYCRPLIARETLGDAFVEPTVSTIEQRGGQVRFGARVRGLEFSENRVRGLMLAEGPVALGPEDILVLAVPPTRAAELVPGLTVPEDGEPILNAHFRLDHPPPIGGGEVPLMGVLGAATQWIAVRGPHVSLTISAAGAFAEDDEAALLPRLWAETRAALGLPEGAGYEAGRIIREKRATFLPTPENVRRRPKAATRWPNLILAGDWTDTGLPATIEGAITSGNTAGRIAAQRLFQ